MRAHFAVVLALVAATSVAFAQGVRRPVSLVVIGGTVLTEDDTRRVFSPGAVAISGSDIVDIGTPADIAARYTAAQTIDARDQVVLPGLVNTHGEIFTAASDDPLPVFSGPPELAGDMAANYAAFDRALAPLGRRVQDIRVSERRAWTVQLEDGMTLELGRERVVERLSKFADAYVTSVGLMKEPPRMVDLRYPNGFAVRLKTVNKGA